jgi:dolichol-phosphate mannosyltransferase
MSESPESDDSRAKAQTAESSDAGAVGASAVICIPTYNEIENLPLIVPAVLEQVPGAHVLVVDDNSPDGTGDLADEMAKDDERIHVLHREGKQGLGKAYLGAFAWALDRDYDYVFEFDADFSHDPKYLPKFIALLEDGADMVVGSRRVKGGGVENWGLHRRFISWGGSVYARVVLGLPIRDLTGGFNGFRRRTLENIGLAEVTSTGYCFQIELKYRACKRGFEVVESPIVFPDRTRGVSKMSGSIFMEAVVQVWRLRRTKLARLPDSSSTDDAND